MSTLNNFGSIAPTFVASVPLKKSPRFLFVTVSNPDEIKNPTKQSIIRRHAKKDADRVRKTRQNPQFESLIENQLNQPAVSHRSIPCNLSAEETLGEQQNQQVDAVYLSSERPPVIERDKSPEWLNKSSSLASLRPLGAGRGLNPFAPYPVEPNSRTIHALDYCMLYPPKPGPFDISS
jgi:hypothetical protein